MTSILEALENAEYNFKNSRQIPPLLDLALNQLHNAIVLLDKGYKPDEDIESLLNQYGKIENVPEVESETIKMKVLKEIDIIREKHPRSGDYAEDGRYVYPEILQEIIKLIKVL